MAPMGASHFWSATRVFFGPSVIFSLRNEVHKFADATPLCLCEISSEGLLVGLCAIVTVAA